MNKRQFAGFLVLQSLLFGRPLTVQAATPTVLATGLNSSQNIVIDDANVYWSEETNSSVAGYPRRIGSISKGSDGSAAINYDYSGDPVLPGNNNNGGYELAVDASYLYYVGNSFNGSAYYPSICRVPKGGGAGSVLVATGNSFWSYGSRRALALDPAAKGIFCQSADQAPNDQSDTFKTVVSIPNSGGPETIYNYSSLFVGQGGHYTINGVTWYYGMEALNHDASVFPSSFFMSGTADLNCLSVGGNHLYWSAASNIWSEPLTGGMPVPLVAGDGLIYAIATPTNGAAAGSVFWIEVAGGTASLMRRDPAGNITTVLPASSDLVFYYNHCFAVNDDKVYCGYTGGLVQVSIYGGTPTVLYSCPPYWGPVGLAVDSTNIYWSAWNGSSVQILRLAQPNPPVITTQPTNATATEGNTTNFTVAATGGAPLAYQWYFQSTQRLSFATSATLTITNCQLVNSGSYFVVVTNASGSVTSSIASLTVGVPPGITIQPVSILLTNGGSTNFSVTASGTSPLSYQWQRNETNLLNGGNISGATANKLSLSAVSTNDVGSYAVIVSNAFGSITSSVVTLGLEIKPSITTQPQLLIVTNGNPARFAVTATGSSPLVYHWQRNNTNLVNGGKISGATNDTLILSATETNDAGNYRVIITNFYGSVTSSIASLTIGVPPGITAQPVSVLVNNGDSTNFMVTASGTAPLTYQWQRNGTNLISGGNISGANAPTLNFSSAGTNDAGSYAVVVDNAYGSATSSVVALTLRIPPNITAQPRPLTVVSGSPASFTVTASGPGPLFYQWKKNNVGLTDDGNVSGSASASLVFSNTTTNDAADYTVIVTNAYGSVTSITATLTVTVPPSFFVLHTFTNYPDGGQPLAGLTLVSNTLYGTTFQGGTNGNGVVYALNTDGSDYRILYQFSPLTSSPANGEHPTNFDGAGPRGGLSYLGNALYGTASQGGLNENGTFFSLKLDGSNFADLYNFLGPTQSWQGLNSAIGDMLPMDGNFYGATVLGYDSLGMLYGLDTNGNFNLVYSFADRTANGDGPAGGLVLLGSTLYGMTVLGGSQGIGNIFAVNTNGSGFAQLFSFPSCSWDSTIYAYTNFSGYNPVGQLVAVSNKLFGMTEYGGINGGGTIFSINADGSDFTVLHAFTVPGSGSTNIDGAYPLTDLLAVGTTLYGSTPSGGTNGNGVVFSINTDGSHFTVLHYMNGPVEGYAPNKLFFHGNRLYGTTRAGGLYNYGTAFSLPVAPTAEVLSGAIVNGGFTMNFSGAPYTTNFVLMATNLVMPIVWQTIATNVTDGNGHWQLTNVNIRGSSQQYYRVATPSN